MSRQHACYSKGKMHVVCMPKVRVECTAHVTGITGTEQAGDMHVSCN
jgi:hypothetical protein